MRSQAGLQAGNFSQAILNFGFLGRDSVLQGAANPSPAKDRDSLSEAYEHPLLGRPVSWSLWLCHMQMSQT